MIECNNSVKQKKGNTLKGMAKSAGILNRV